MAVQPAAFRVPAGAADWPAQPPAPPRATIREVLGKLSEPIADPSDLRNRDVAFIQAISPALWSVGARYFRFEVEGVEHIPPRGRYIAVGNHGGAPLLPDVVVLSAWWAVALGLERPSYIMVHDFPFRVPILRTMLAKCGALPASRENAERALRAGANILCFPGGELDCLRSFRNRNRIDFYGRSGFVELAFKYGLPILPFVNVGGHEVYVTLFSSRRLARWSGLERFTKVRSVPLIAGLPWGLWLTGFLPYIPLPAKLVYKAAPPIPVEHDPERARDRRAVRRVYRRVTTTMQAMVDELAARRRLPIIG